MSNGNNMHDDPFHQEGQGATEELLTPEQVAKRLRVSPRWVRDHVARRQPRIPAVDLGSRIRFRPSDVDEFIKARGQATGAKKGR
jgi:excisionase family DNA binding protein